MVLWTERANWWLRLAESFLAKIFLICLSDFLKFGKLEAL